MNIAGMNERAARAKDDETEFNSLVGDYRPFIASCACKASGRYVDAHDDEMSIALIAFAEAVRRYRLEAGNFRKFASSVIRSRMIDHIRKAGRKVECVPIDIFEDSDAGEGPNPRLAGGQISQGPQSRFDDPIKLEIDALSSDLKEYGFIFLDVAKCAPKSTKTREACQTVTRRMLAEPLLLAHMKKTRQLPVRQLAKICGVPLKIIERHRKYIVCVVEIESGDYAYLSEFIDSGRKE